MAITVFETTKRYNRLIELANRLGFSVEEKDAYMIWTAENKAKYLVVPYVNNFELPDKKVLKNKIVIAVCLDEVIAGKATNEVSLSEVEALNDKVDKNIITLKQAQALWDGMFRKSSLSAMLDLLEKSNKSETSTSAEGDKASDEKKEKSRTVVVTACGPDIYIKLLSKKLRTDFESIGKKMFIDKKDTIILQLVSKLYERKSYDEYWYSVHAYQIDEMSKHAGGYYSFGFSGRNVTVLIEKQKLVELLPHLTESPNNGDTYWHIKINTNKNGEFYILKTKKGEADIDINITEGILIVNGEDFGSHIEVRDEKPKSKRITLRDTELREVSCKKKRR